MMDAPRRQLLAPLAVGLCALLAFPAGADAQVEREEFEDTIHVVQRKPLLEEGRVELVPRIGVSINDTVYRTPDVGLQAHYYIDERIFAGARFDWYEFGGALGGKTKVFDESFRQTRTAPDAAVPRWHASAEGGYTPIYGKFTAFNWAILYYEISGTLGAGVMNAETLVADPSLSWAATGSVNFKFFVNDWFAVNFEVRDILFPVTLGTAQSRDTVANLVTVGAGASFFFPTSFEYPGESPEK
ncbi:MAG: outer membrane beta-barrel domain-containing protein [Bradymonadaceae bacterium]